MNFEISEEQQIIQESVARFLADHYELRNRIELTQSKKGFSESHWNTFAELGWLALPFDESVGGLGGNQIDTMILMEEFGKTLVVEPFFASIILGGGVLRYSGNNPVLEKLLPGVIDGSTQLALAYAEKQARFSLNDVSTSARSESGDFILSGIKSMVLNAATADKLIVSARTSSKQSDADGISLFIVDADADGVSLENFATVDGQRASEVTFEEVRVGHDSILGTLDNGLPILQAVANDAILALAAEAVGAMEILYKDTVLYTQEREQFGHPLSDFQVLKHQMVEMYMEYEQCKSLLYRATLETVRKDKTAQRTLHALKYLVGKAGIFIGESAVQLHGGMGMSEELRVSHYFKRLLALDSQFGNADYHLQRFVD